VSFVPEGLMAAGMTTRGTVKKRFTVVDQQRDAAAIDRATKAPRKDGGR